MALRLGVDLDGVLADMEGRLQREALTLFGAPDPSPPAGVSGAELGEQVSAVTVPDALPLPKLALTARQQRRLWEHVRSIDGFWDTLDETEPGIVARLGSLSAAHDWEILFLTRRPSTAGETSQRQSQRWLTRKGFELPSVYVVSGSRGRIASALALDIVVDDTPENCLDIATDSKAIVVAVLRGMTTPPPALRNLGIRAVSSTGAALDLLSEIDAGVREPRGPLDRVKRLFKRT